MCGPSNTRKLHANCNHKDIGFCLPLLIIDTVLGVQMAMANYTGMQEAPRPAAPRPRRPKREYEQAETEAIIEGCRRYATSTRKWHDIMKARRVKDICPVFKP